MKKSKKNSSTGSKKYVFVEAPSKDFTAIKLTEGKWKDVILKYGKVAFAKDENKDGTLPMKFDYDILKFPKSLKGIKYDEKFTNYIGDILVEILEKDQKNYPIEGQTDKFYDKRYNTEKPIVYDYFYEVMSVINERAKNNAKKEWESKVGIKLPKMSKVTNG